MDRFEQKVDTVIQVSSFDRRLENIEKATKYPDFWNYKIDIEKIKSLAGRFIVVHSKDDSFIPYEQGERIAEELGAELTTEESKGHFSTEDGEEEIAKYIIKIIRSVM